MLPVGASEEEIKASKAEARANIENTVKEFLNPVERFAERMRSSMQESDDANEQGAVTQHLIANDAKGQLGDIQSSGKLITYDFTTMFNPQLMTRVLSRKTHRITSKVRRRLVSVT